MEHGYGGGCRCTECCWDQVVQFLPLVVSITNDAHRRNPGIVQDFNDLYSYLVARAFQAAQSYSTGPIEAGGSMEFSNWLRLSLNHRTSSYIKLRFANNRRVQIAMAYVPEGTEVKEQAEDDPGFEEVETRWEGKIMLDWVKEHYVRARTEKRRKAQEKNLKRFLMKLDGQTLDEIAKRENCTPQAISDSYLRVVRYARANAEEVLGVRP